MANIGNQSVKSRGLSDLHIPELQEKWGESHIVRASDS